MITYEGASNFFQIFSHSFCFSACIVALFNTTFAVIIARKFMQIMQQNGYVRRSYDKWTYRKDNIYLIRLLMVVMLSVMAYLLFTIGFSYTTLQWNSYVGFIFYVFFLAVYIYFDFKRKSKSILVLTARAVRLIVTFVIIYYLLTLAILFGCQALGYVFKENRYFVDVRFGVLCATPLLIPVIVEFANFINKPFENANNKKYIDRTKKTLQEAKGLIKIGLTGSYGKTSVKEILRSILSVKYNVLATPASYNTPMGICKSVKRYDGTQDVFIAEMGARRIGEIRELVDIVKPDFAIITGIGNQHLGTFGTLEAVLKTKYELVAGVKEGGTVVFASDNDNTFALSERAKSEKRVDVVTAGINSERANTVYCKDIVTDQNGSEFTIVFPDTEIKVSTVLIGKHNVSNIMVAVCASYKLGLTPQEIAEGIAQIKPIRHRLEVLKNDKGMTIIDDSYNSNVDGTIAALEVISSYEGRKIIVTPGLVELGRMEDLENFRFGRRMAKVADIVIIVGGPNAYKIRDGLLDEDFNYDNIKIVPSLSDAIKYLNEISTSGDIVLFENDLPDKFM